MAAEEVLLLLDNVRFKKNNGKLKLLSDKLMWIADGADNPRLNYGYSEIKVQRISPEGSSKVQLQTILHDGNSYSFHFTNNSFPDAEKRDRDEVKDLLSQLIPAHRKKANKDLEEKSRLFQDNPDLHQLYRDLVMSGVISAEEFWSNRGNAQMSGSKMKTGDEQTVGLSSGFLSDVKPESSGCNELRYNLDADTIGAIFKTYPAVKNKYQETVPEKMNEKEFWTKFFQSHFFHRDRQKTSSDLFLECANHDEQEFLEARLLNFYDRLFDISESSPVSGQGYGQTSSPDLSEQKNSRNDNLFRRFNHQSSMVLKAYSNSSSHSLEKPNVSEGEPPAKMGRLREMVTYEDLEEENEPKSIVLKITNKNQFSEGMATSVEATLSSRSTTTPLTNGVDNTSYIKQCTHDIKTWKPDLTKALSTDCACEVLTEFSPGGQLLGDTPSSDSNSTGPQSFQTELRHHYNAVTELLRHFWSCFPVTSPFLEEKVARMATCLEKYNNVKLHNFITTLDNPTYGEHLSKMIEVAMTKFRTLQEKKSRIKLN